MASKSPLTRRSFLAAIAGAFVVDPERALWTPGAKLISIPASIIKPEPLNLHISSVYSPVRDAFLYTIRAIGDPTGAGNYVQMFADRAVTPEQFDKYYLTPAVETLRNMQYLTARRGPHPSPRGLV